MQRRVRELIYQFTARDNAEFLFDELNTGDKRILGFLNDNFMESLARWSRKTWQEYNNNSPMPGLTVLEELNYLNRGFLTYMKNQINAHVRIEEAPAYVVNDGMPTSRRGIKHHSMAANDILETWKHNSSGGLQSRGDRQADGRQLRNNDNLLETGITFCDQSGLGLNNHEEMFMNNSYVKALNSGGAPHTDVALGNYDNASDLRLLSRRIFRNSEDGVENGIPRYERRLYRRNLDRDIDEALPGDSFEFKQYGHDMESLYNRTDNKNHHQARPPGSKLRLENHVWVE